MEVLFVSLLKWFKISPGHTADHPPWRPTHASFPRFRSCHGGDSCLPFPCSSASCTERLVTGFSFLVKLSNCETLQHFLVASSESKHKMQDGTSLNLRNMFFYSEVLMLGDSWWNSHFVVGRDFLVVHLLPREDETLLWRRDSFLLFHALLSKEYGIKENEFIYLIVIGYSIFCAGQTSLVSKFTLIRSTLSVGSMSISISFPVRVFTLISILAKTWWNQHWALKRKSTQTCLTSGKLLRRIFRKTYGT